MKKIPLNIRLRRIRKGCAGDENYYFSTIKTLAEMKMLDYMTGCEFEFQRLAQLLGVSDSELADMTFSETANIILRKNNKFLRACRFEPNDEGRLRLSEAESEATSLLAEPFRRKYQERKHIYASLEEKLLGETTAASA